MSIIKIIVTLPLGGKISCDQTPVLKKPPTSWRGKEAKRHVYVAEKNHYISLLFFNLGAQTVPIEVHVGLTVILRIFMVFLSHLLSVYNLYRGLQCAFAFKSR